MDAFIGILLYGLIFNTLPLAVIALLLFLARVPKSRLIFFTFALFGILSGLAAALYGHSDGQYIYNALGVGLGDELYGYAAQHFGDP
ncbi:MAG: hypothetical protein MUO92_04285, partial [Dehalococcoidales bacterium]|nr:hypothetical protein [Dehalococcoidales bacterium]